MGTSHEIGTALDDAVDPNKPFPWEGGPWKDSPINPPAPTGSAQPVRGPLIQLSDFLQGVPPGELIQVLADFPASLESVIEGVALPRDVFGLRVTDLRGRTVTIKVTNHMIRDTPEAREWLRARRRASLLTLLEYTGLHPSEAQKLWSGEDDFDAVVQATRAWNRRQNPVLAAESSPAQTRHRKPGLGDLGSPTPAPAGPYRHARRHR